MEILGRERDIAREHPFEQTSVAFEGQVYTKYQNKTEEKALGIVGCKRSIQGAAQEEWNHA